MFVSSLQLRDSQYHLFVQPALSFRCKELQSCSVKVPVVKALVTLVTLVTKEVKYVALAACFALGAGHPGCPR